MDTGYPIQLKSYSGEVWLRENRQLPRPENEEHSRSLKSHNKSFRKKQEISHVYSEPATPRTTLKHELCQ